MKKNKVDLPKIRHEYEDMSELDGQTLINEKKKFAFIFVKIHFLVSEGS